jgi:hypothetical protein
LASRKQESSGPVVTSLPLPSSDSVLVIDLPDGQKLLVGKMPNGSVIEVATWRGTGRPDSRTNRLMLGMNSEESISPDVNQQEVSEPEKINKSFLGKLFARIGEVSKIGPKVIIPLKKFLGSKPDTETNTSQRPQSLAKEDDVQLWLNEITERISRKQAAPKAKKVPSGVSKRTAAPNKGPKSQRKVVHTKKK